MVRVATNGLGRRFVASLSATLALIQALPSVGALAHRDVRRVLLRRFPYAVYYRVTADTIEVRACLHQRRNRLSWRRSVG